VYVNVGANYYDLAFEERNPISCGEKPRVVPEFSCRCRKDRVVWYLTSPHSSPAASMLEWLATIDIYHTTAFVPNVSINSLRHVSKGSSIILDDDISGKTSA
jgi:hypothetical protein